MGLQEEIDGLIDDELEHHPMLLRFESGVYKGASKTEMIELLTSMVDLLILRDRAMVRAIRHVAAVVDELPSARASQPDADGGSSLRSRLERLLEQLGETGHIPPGGERELTIRLDECGRIKWVDATRLRVPATQLDREGSWLPPPYDEDDGTRSGIDDSS